MIKRLTALLCLIAAPPCAAQIVGTPSQALTASTNVATIPMAGVPSVSITVSGTWTGSLTFNFVVPPATACSGTLSSVDVAPIVAGARITTTSSNGTWVLDNAGFLTACVYASTISSGTATITAVRGFRSPASVVVQGDTPANAGRTPTIADINNPSLVDASNRALVVGCVAADADGSACYPLFIGGNASTAVPTAMSADTDSVRAWFTRNGAMHVVITVGTSTLSNISGSASSVALLAANTARLGAKCFNDSTAILYLNYGATASATAFTEYVPPGGTWTMDPQVYTGAINGLWSSATGAARCTELTQ